MVNKAFHRIFMSDQLWHKLDFYHVQHNISTHSLVESRQFTHSKKIAIAHDEQTRGILGRFWYSAPECGCPPSCAHCEVARYHLEGAGLYVEFVVLANNADRLGTACSWNKLNAAVRYALVAEHGLLCYGTSEQQNEFELVLRVVSRRPRGLEFASREMRNNPTIVATAMIQDPSVCCFAGRRARRWPRVYGLYMAHLQRDMATQLTARSRRLVRIKRLVWLLVPYAVICGVDQVLRFGV